MESEEVASLNGEFSQLAIDLHTETIYAIMYDESHQKTKVVQIDAVTRKHHDLKLAIQGQVFNIGNNKVLIQDRRMFIRSQLAQQNFFY